MLNSYPSRTRSHISVIMQAKITLIETFLNRIGLMSFLLIATHAGQDIVPTCLATKRRAKVAPRSLENSNNDNWKRRGKNYSGWTIRPAKPMIAPSMAFPMPPTNLARTTKSPDEAKQ